MNTTADWYVKRLEDELRFLPIFSFPKTPHCASLSNSFGSSNRTLRSRSLLGRFASGEACSSGSILKEQASALVLPITRFINSCAAEQIRLQPFWRMLCSMTIIEKLITQRNLLLVVLDKWDKRNGCCPVFYFVGWQEACSVIVPADIWTTINHIENGGISFFWSWSYWSTFLLTW